MRQVVTVNGVSDGTTLPILTNKHRNNKHTKHHIQSNRSMGIMDNSHQKTSNMQVPHLISRIITRITTQTTMETKMEDTINTNNLRDKNNMDRGVMKKHQLKSMLLQVVKAISA